MAFTSWDFSAHDFSEDQLVHAAFLMLQHALSMPELESWRIPAGKPETPWDTIPTIIQALGYLTLHAQLIFTLSCWPAGQPITPLSTITTSVT